MTCKRAKGALEPKTSKNKKPLNKPSNKKPDAMRGMVAKAGKSKRG